jgi:hypothetical protein
LRIPFERYEHFYGSNVFTSALSCVFGIVDTCLTYKRVYAVQYIWNNEGVLAQWCIYQTCDPEVSSSHPGRAIALSTWNSRNLFRVYLESFKVGNVRKCITNFLIINFFPLFQQLLNTLHSNYILYSISSNIKHLPATAVNCTLRTFAVRKLFYFQSPLLLYVFCIFFISAWMFLL